MFGFLKNILRRPVEAPAENQAPPAEMEYAEPAPPPAPTQRSAAARQNGGRSSAGYHPAGHQAGGYQPAGHQGAGYQPAGHRGGGYQNAIPSQRSSHQNGSGKGVELSLQKVLEGLPLELQPRVRH